MFLLGFNNGLYALLDAKIDDLIAIISEDYIYKIFANIMHISLDSGD